MSYLPVDNVGNTSENLYTNSKSIANLKAESQDAFTGNAKYVRDFITNMNYNINMNRHMVTKLLLPI